MLFLRRPSCEGRNLWRRQEPLAKAEPLQAGTFAGGNHLNFSYKGLYQYFSPWFRAIFSVNLPFPAVG